jgi:hypothetical protein
MHSLDTVPSLVSSTVSSLSLPGIFETHPRLYRVTFPSHNERWNHSRRRFFGGGRFLLEDEDEDEDEDEEDESESELELELEDELSGRCMIIFGMFLRWLRRSSVMPPRPIDVKKLIAKRVLRGLSRGIRPSKYCAIKRSSIRSLSFGSPDLGRTFQRMLAINANPPSGT